MDWGGVERERRGKDIQIYSSFLNTISKASPTWILEEPSFCWLLLRTSLIWFLLDPALPPLLSRSKRKSCYYYLHLSTCWFWERGVLEHAFETLGSWQSWTNRNHNHDGPHPTSYHCWYSNGILYGQGDEQKKDERGDDHRVSIQCDINKKQHFDESSHKCNKGTWPRRRVCWRSAVYWVKEKWDCTLW